MCLAHTSGFPNWRWFEPDKQLRVKFEPGSRYSYSGEGMAYLRVVLENRRAGVRKSWYRIMIFKYLQYPKTSSIVTSRTSPKDFRNSRSRCCLLPSSRKVKFRPLT